jgi:ribosomal protein S18 acetylase RimI-like enzyme
MLKDVIFRQIRESDAQSIQIVALEAWQYTYHSIFEQQFIENFVNRNYAPEATISLFPRLQSGTMYFYVAEHESKIIGFCNIGINEQTAELYRIYLLPFYIGQGIGQKLLQLGEKFIAENDISIYHCFVHKDNEIGRRFYLQYDFQHIAERDHDDEWYMEKRITKD